jgi:hypothetical protein
VLPKNYLFRLTLIGDFMSINKYWKFDNHSDSDVIRALRSAAKFGKVTHNGFPYDSSLSSEIGARYFLYVPFLSLQRDIDDAVYYIRNYIGDVVGKISVVRVESEMYLHQFSERKSYPNLIYKVL